MVASNNLITNPKILIILAVVILFIFSGLSLFAGYADITLKDLYDIFNARVSFLQHSESGTLAFLHSNSNESLINSSSDNDARISFLSSIIFDVRLPRILLVIVVGFGLSVAGAILQGLFRNALASPDIVGVSSGAGLFVVVIYSFFPSLLAYVSFFSILGSMTALAIIYILSFGRYGDDNLRLILAGVIISTFFGSMMIMISVYNPTRFIDVNAFLIGSFSNAEWQKVYTILPYIIFSFFVVRYFANELNIIIIDDEAAQLLGIRVNLYRLMFIFFAVLLASICVSVAGILGFIGLIAPHVARMIIGVNYRSLLLFSGLVGSIYLLLCDTIGRTMFGASDIPAGIISSFFGAPFFLYLLRNGRA